MRRIAMIACCLAALTGQGCKKAMDKLESSATTPAKSSPAAGPYSGGGNPSVDGATQAVRGAVERTVTQNELKQLHLFMYNAYTADGQVPVSTATYQVIYKEDQKLYNLIKDGLVVLVERPTPEGVWAYVREAPERGGLVVTQQGVDRMTAAQFAALPK